MQNASLIIEFAPGSRVQPGEEPLHRALSMNVLFSNGQNVSLPADQVVFFEDSHGAARVGLGGMSFEGLENQRLVFWRVLDILPEEYLSPQREIKLMLMPEIVQTVHVGGNRVWPAKLQKKNLTSEPELH